MCKDNVDHHNVLCVLSLASVIKRPIYIFKLLTKNIRFSLISSLIPRNFQDSSSDNDRVYIMFC